MSDDEDRGVVIAAYGMIAIVCGSAGFLLGWLAHMWWL